MIPQSPDKDYISRDETFPNTKPGKLKVKIRFYDAKKCTRNVLEAQW
jgi:hypothetical protein